jgi:hypothetical protein
VSGNVTEALDLTTPPGRAMAGLLAVYAAFEREILGERLRAGLAHVQHNGKRRGRPPTAARYAAEIGWSTRVSPGRLWGHPRILRPCRVGRKLIDVPGYTFRIFVTSCADGPAEIRRDYNRRADMENRIAELKHADTKRALTSEFRLAS